MRFKLIYGMAPMQQYKEEVERLEEQVEDNAEHLNEVYGILETALKKEIVSLQQALKQSRDSLSEASTYIKQLQGYNVERSNTVDEESYMNDEDQLSFRFFISKDTVRNCVHTVARVKEFVRNERHQTENFTDACKQALADYKLKCVAQYHADLRREEKKIENPFAYMCKDG